MQIDYKNNELKEVMRHLFYEIINEEKENIVNLIMPTISKDEQDDIDSLYGKPSDFKESDFVDASLLFQQ